MSWLLYFVICRADSQHFGVWGMLTFVILKYYTCLSLTSVLSSISQVLISQILRPHKTWSLHGLPFAGRASLPSRKSLKLVAQYVMVFYQMHSQFVQLICTIGKATGFEGEKGLNNRKHLYSYNFQVEALLKMANSCKGWIPRKIKWFFQYVIIWYVHN